MNRCPDHAALRRLLDSALPDAERADLGRHLESCARCRGTLDQLASQGASLSGPANGKGDTQALPAAGFDPPTNAEAADRRSADNEWTFLAPPKRRGDLGQLDHYAIKSLIGKGGMGLVFQAFDESLHRVVAIKTLAVQLTAGGTARTRFVREARAAAAIRNEHVVSIHAIGGENAVPYIVMEFIRGVSLQELIDQQGPLKLEEILRIGHQIARGLAAAHGQRVIHRDIKPGNILLEDGDHRVKVTDFGLARTVDDASVTQPGVVAGTPMYMAPEQAADDPLDHRADLFSLGSVLYAMCTGRPPFRAAGAMATLLRVCEDTPRPIRETNPEIPQWLVDIISRLHAKKPANRIQTAQEVAELLADRHAESRGSRAFAWPAANRPAVVALIAASTLALASIAGVVWFWPRSDDRIEGPGPIARIDPPPKQKEVGNDWVPLFNGKNLDGWKREPENTAAWNLEDGILFAVGDIGYLAATRDDFRDFHLRAELKINPMGDSGFFFRVPPGTPVSKSHYEAEIWGDGFLHVFRRENGEQQHIWTSKKAMPADRWVVYELIVRGGRIMVKVDDDVFVDVEDPAPRLVPGRIVLQSQGGGTRVQFRKVEIKALPL